MQIGIVELPENEKLDMFGYEVTVFTGSLPNCGTTSTVSISIMGVNSHTEARYLLHKNYPIFQQGSIDSFLLTTEKDLGTLEQIR